LLVLRPRWNRNGHFSGSDQVATEAQFLRLRPAFVLSILMLVSFGLALMDLGTSAFREELGSDQVRRLFNVDEEASIPTWVSGAQLLLASAILMFIAWLRGARNAATMYWWLLAIVFMVLSIDEIASIHEHSSLGLSAIGFNGPWVLAGAAIVSALGVMLIPFLLSLPTEIRLLFIASAAISIGGAMGIELIHLETEAGDTSFRTSLIPAAEEFMERSGFALFIYSLLRYLMLSGVRGVGVGRNVVPLERGSPRVVSDIA